MNLSHLRSARWAVFVTLAAGCWSVSSPPTPAGGEAPAPAATPAAGKSLDAEEGRVLPAGAPDPRVACFQGTPLEQVPCGAPPQGPRRIPASVLSQLLGAGPPGHDKTPELFNGSHDFNASVTGSLVWAQGSFPAETGGASESDTGGQALHGGANSYSLQLNTNLFSTSFCSTSTNSQCKGWEQFVYDPLRGIAFIEFSLIAFGGSCPAQFGSSYFADPPANTVQVCYFDSASVPVPAVAPSSLTNVQMITSTSGGNDFLTMMVNGTPYKLQLPSTLGLGNGGWNDAEFNIYGEDNGDTATFNTTTALEVQVLTQSATPTRAAPSCPSGLPSGGTAEQNSLNFVGGCCAFGGDKPGIQFLESNDGGTANPCPTLAPTPSTASVPAGAWGSSNIQISGNLVGQSSNTALLPSSCWVTYMSLSGAQWRGGTSNLLYGIGPEIDYWVPSTTPVGTNFLADVSCDNGQSTTQEIQVTSPQLTASPNPLKVLAGGCAGNHYSDANLTWTNAGYCQSLAYTTQGAPPGVTVDPSSGAYIAVCDSTGVTQAFSLTVTGTGCTSGPVSTTVQVEIVSCIPKTTCGNSCSQTTPDGCGGTIDCSGTACPSGSSCSSGLLCCPYGQSVPPGGTACACPTGTTWDAGLLECVPNSQLCHAPRTWCACMNECLTPTTCMLNCS